MWREVVADTVTPVLAFTRLVGDKPGFLFESVETGERWGRYSFIGRDPLCKLRSEGGAVRADGRLDMPSTIVERYARGMLATIEEIVSAFRSAPMPGLPPLHSGLVGYLGYDVVREVEKLTDPPPDDLHLPDALMWVAGEVCAFDHWRQRAVLVENVQVPRRRVAAGRGQQACAQGEGAVNAIGGDTGGDEEGDLAGACMAIYHAALGSLDVMEAELSGGATSAPLDAGESARLASFSRTMTSRQYMDAVEVAREHIVAGDIFQVVFSQRYDFELEADPFDVYRVLRLVNPSPYLYFLRFEECTVVGSSPEPMVRSMDGAVISRPIAGTRRRGGTDREDRAMEADLVEHPKEIAEHIMLVDLARNDLGKVVDFGTEKVDELMTVERYSHVMHLTSQVSGRLSEGRGPVDVIRATIPAGTLSGAPKVRAMEIIDSLEVTKRGVYGGLVGYVDFCGNLDSAIAIRTMVVTPDGIGHVQAGAGIVADSDPELEDKECLHKASALLAAVAAARTSSTPGATPGATPPPDSPPVPPASGQ